MLNSNLYHLQRYGSRQQIHTDHTRVLPVRATDREFIFLPMSAYESVPPRINRPLEFIFFILLTFLSSGIIICTYTTYFGGSLWNTSRLLKLVIFVTAQRTAVAANARLPASPLARQAAVLLISSAKIPKQRKASNYKDLNAALQAAFLSVRRIYDTQV